MISYGRQDIDADDIAAVVAVLGSDFLTQGPAIERFEEAVAARCGVRFAVAMSSATAALHAACAALDVGPGDAIWTSPNTFVASANCARYCGADVDFVDIDAGTLNLSLDALEEKLGRQAAPKAVIPVHFAGQSCDMTRIGSLRERHGFRVIEDASHAIGGRFAGVPVGACTHSDIAVFSFHPVKIITTAEGGMAVTNDPVLAARLRRFRSHGITRDPAEMVSGSEGPWYYEQIELGYNYRMTDIQAALGSTQLARIDAFVARRRALAARYRSALAGLPLRMADQHPAAESSWHLFVICLAEAAGPTRREVYDGLVARGVRPQVHYIPVHLQPYYQALGFRRGDFPEAERYYDGALTLPLYPGLRDDQQDVVVAALVELLG